MAAIRTILVQAERTDAGAAFLNEAAAFAAARNAHLVALAVGIETTPAYAGLPDIPLDSYFTELEAVREEVKETRKWADGVLARAGISYEVRGIVMPMSDAGATFARQARYADVTFLLRSDTDLSWHRLVDAVLFDSGRPVVLCPPGVPFANIGKRVAIAWDAGAEAARAVGSAIDLVPTAEKVHVVMIDPRVSPDGHGEEPGADISTMLARHGYDVIIDSIPRADLSVASALLHHVEGIDADLIVAGAYGHSRLTEIILGGVTRDLLEKADRPLLMAH